MCSECGRQIRPTSVRCRACNARRASIASPANKPQGERALTDAEKSARWRELHPGRSRDVNLQAKQRRRAQLAEIKAGRGCRSSGIRDPRVLDFHHRHGEDKVLAVSVLIYRRRWDSVLSEIGKCDVLCANCHRIEHAEEPAQIAAAGFYRAS